MADEQPSLDLLWQLLKMDSPSGDEAGVADWLGEFTARALPEARIERLGDSLIVQRGDWPSVAVFAHMDTTGFTLGYDRKLISIGSPAGESGDKIRTVRQQFTKNILTLVKSGGWRLEGETDAPPGSRWVYASEAHQEGDWITSPYLDNRAGLWAAMQVLQRCKNITVAFTVCEEHSGRGALVCARHLYERHGIAQALISDITWDTAHVHCGRGVAISLRDECVPRQRYLDRVLALAEESGLPFQREIESGGSSDGGFIERSGVPLSWVFVGAPEQRPHTSAERIHVGDLYGMADMLTYLVKSLTDDADNHAS